MAGKARSGTVKEWSALPVSAEPAAPPTPAAAPARTSAVALVAAAGSSVDPGRASVLRVLALHAFSVLLLLLLAEVAGTAAAALKLELPSWGTALVVALNPPAFARALPDKDEYGEPAIIIDSTPRKA